MKPSIKYLTEEASRIQKVEQLQQSVLRAQTRAVTTSGQAQRTANTVGGNMFGVYAQTSFSNNPTSTISGLNTAVYGVVDCGTDR